MKASELETKDLRAWSPLMHAAWSASAEVFRAVVAAIELALGKDQVGALVWRPYFCLRFIQLLCTVCGHDISYHV